MTRLTCILLALCLPCLSQCNGNGGEEEDADVDQEIIEEDSSDDPGPGDPDLTEAEDVPVDETPEPGCGNGVVEAGEECDDGNDVGGDGCENDCTFSCTEDSDCDDGDVCSGAETCDADTHTCQAGEAMEDGYVCGTDPRSICLEAVCGESVCGDGFVDTGWLEFCEPPGVDGCTEDCQWTCMSDYDCPDDGNPCNGEDFCDLEAHLCDRRDPLEDGVECGSDPRLICIAQSCQASACGDGYVDAAGGEDCEDGNTTDGDGCDNDCTFSCTAANEAVDCDDSRPCTVDACNETTHTCANSFAADTVVCRPAAGICDAAESCTGDSADCPADAFQPDTLECRPSEGPGDNAEYCTGLSAYCPDDLDDALLGISSVTTGNTHTCALMEAGGIKCWGENFWGQLGDGTRTDSPTYVDVSGISSGVSVLAAGGGHSCALMDTGVIQCWGLNEWGQLGDGALHEVCEYLWDLDPPRSIDCSRLPVTVQGITTAVSIAAGGSHTCALLSTGAVKCWGDNDKGQLGYGIGGHSTTPMDVTGLSSGVAAIAAGGEHTCALMDTGGVKCWGNNYSGQIGDGTLGVNRGTPVDVVGLSSGVAAIEAGGEHTCALMDTGGVKCWGNSRRGQLGDGSTGHRTTPVDVVGLSYGVSAVSAGASHTCALMAGGGIKCWGDNSFGQVGDGTMTQRDTPVDVYELSYGVTAVSAGGFSYGLESHTCALMDTGGVKCWGLNDSGQLGDGTSTRQSTPLDVTGLASGMSAVACGSNFTCALAAAGGVTCWGNNNYGQLGDGTTTLKIAPVQVFGLTSGASAVTAGGGYIDYNHACALMDTGGVACWGSNMSGQLGDGTSTDSLVPVGVSGLASGVSAVDAGKYHTCALTDAGGAKCWGSNSDGQLGDGTSASKNTPVDVLGLASGVAALSAGGRHTCALLDTGGVKCWGITPADVPGLTSGVSAITAGEGHGCALLDTGAVQCWGDNYSGQLGDGTTTNSATPVDVSGLSSGVTAIAAGWNHTCALLDTGGAMCWGSNDTAQLGNGTRTNSSIPVDVSGLASGVSGISVGNGTSCALMSSGGVLCWGTDTFGQVSGKFQGYPRYVVSL